MSDLSFLEPSRLWLLLLPIGLVIAYLVVQRHRRRYAVRFTNMALLDEVAPDKPGWRRHVPALVLSLGVVAATLAFARPALADQVTDKNGVVILAIDTSLSMQATDVQPNRLAAAKAAAKAFLDNVPDGVKIGVVGFDGEATQLLAPTANTEAVARTIDKLQLGEGTAIGEAVYTSLSAIEATLDREAAKAGPQTGATTTAPAAGASAKSPATIVLLSDGETTVGRSNDQAAKAAEAQDVPVHTIAFGTDGGSVRTPDGQTVNVPVNRQALQKLARQTGGRYFPAASAEQLKQVYEQLGKSVTTTTPVEKEIGDWFTGASIALLGLAAAGSLLWFSRLP